MTHAEILKMLEKQLRLLSEQSETFKDSYSADSISRITEQMVNVAKLLLDF